MILQQCKKNICVLDGMGENSFGRWDSKSFFAPNPISVQPHSPTEWEIFDAELEFAYFCDNIKA